MTHVYRIDIEIAGTLYIKAASQEEAKRIAAAQSELCIEVDGGGNSDLVISGAQFDDPALPTVSLSPAMTVKGIYDFQDIEEVDGIDEIAHAQHAGQMGGFEA